MHTHIRPINIETEWEKIFSLESNIFSKINKVNSIAHACTRIIYLSIYQPTKQKEEIYEWTSALCLCASYKKAAIFQFQNTISCNVRWTVSADLLIRIFSSHQSVNWCYNQVANIFTCILHSAATTIATATETTKTWNFLIENAFDVYREYGKK